MNYEEKTINSEYLYKGKIVNLRKDLVQLPEGKKSTREVVEHKGAVAIVPITEKKEVILVKQYRKAVEEVLLEIPAGKLEEKEDPRECAVRELEEETGMKTDHIQELFSFYTSPGFSNEKLYLYVALKLREGEQNLDSDEYVEVEVKSLDEALQMIKRGEIKDAKTITGLFAVRDYIEGLK